jgi:hypothetical protein
MIAATAATVSVLCRVADPDDSPAQQARRTSMADEWKRSVYNLRDRAITRLEENMAQVEDGIPGAINAKRLRGIRDLLAVDPFVGLEIDADDEEANEDPAYWELNMEARKAVLGRAIRRERRRLALTLPRHFRHLRDSRQ